MTDSQTPHVSPLIATPVFLKHQQQIENLEPMVRHPFAAPWLGRKAGNSFRSLVQALEIYAGVYLIIHRPTGAVYVGKGDATLAPILRQWATRLSSISGTPPLNVAFRAVYTSRYDFDFALVWCGAPSHNNLIYIKQQYGSMYEKVRALYPSGQCLNVEKPAIERRFWARHLGLSLAEQHRRFDVANTDRRMLADLRKSRREQKKRNARTLENTLVQARNEHAITAAPDTGNGGQPVVRKKIIIPGYNDGHS